MKNRSILGRAAVEYPGGDTVKNGKRSLAGIAFHCSVRLALVLGFVTVAFNAEISAAPGDRVCDFTIVGCPEDFDGDTIVVPDDVSLVSTRVRACKPTEIEESVGRDDKPPSVVFIVDHSGSMTGTGTGNNDQWGARFRVVNDMLDTIYAIHPDAEVGLVVFREHLFFDSRHPGGFDEILQTPSQVYDGEPDQAYVKLVQLNRRYGTRTGKELLEGILKVDTLSEFGSDHEYVDLEYQPEFDNEGWTNINVAFEAAKEAMQSASNPRDRRYFIFFSDGLPRPPDRDHAGYPPYHFVRGEDIPTTFTVFFSEKEGDSAPDSIEQMTENIRDNGYSAGNPSSEVWTIQASYETLLDLLMRSVIGTILEVTVGTPTRMTLDSSLTSSTFTDSFFVFQRQHPLRDTLDYLTLDISYTLKNERTGTQRDTSVHVAFHVARRAGAGVPRGIAVDCWYEEGLQVLYDGRPVSVVTEDMTRLQVRFSPGKRSVDEVEVELTHRQGTPRDRETIDLSSGEPWWTASFERQTSTEAVPGDGTLQHGPKDSIIVVYRNPADPTDTLRLALPFSVGRSVAPYAATYVDRNADGFVDGVYVGIDGGIDAADVASLVGFLDLPSHRGFVVDSSRRSGSRLLLSVREEGSSVPSTGVSADDKLVVRDGALAGGGWLFGDTIAITDSVAPVLLQARIRPGPGGEDTLEVTFSEAVEPTNYRSPFLFRTPEGMSYDVTVSSTNQSEARGSFRIETVTGVEMPMESDSVWINPSALITDRLDNVQRNPRNRRVLLRIKTRPFDVIPRVVNNPLRPEKATVPDFIRNLEGIAEQQGMVIMVEPEVQPRRAPRLSGTVSIYDVVKNPIVVDKPMAYDSNTGRLYVVWDGTNSKGRLVATGTYLAVVDVSGGEELKKRRRLRVGVKR